MRQSPKPLIRNFVNSEFLFTEKCIGFYIFTSYKILPSGLPQSLYSFLNARKKI